MIPCPYCGADIEIYISDNDYGMNCFGKKIKLDPIKDRCMYGSCRNCNSLIPYEYRYYTKEEIIEKLKQKIKTKNDHLKKQKQNLENLQNDLFLVQNSE